MISGAIDPILYQRCEVDADELFGILGVDGYACHLGHAESGDRIESDTRFIPRIHHAHDFERACFHRAVYKKSKSGFYNVVCRCARRERREVKLE
jgi:hypothetical protein